MTGTYEKFLHKTLTEADLREWIRKQYEITRLTEKEIKHVAMCLHHIYLWYHDKQPLGHFLTAVVKNDLMKACGSADATNSKVFTLYAKFLYNYVPADYSIKAKKLEL